jgi:hypothetical protein
MSNTSITVKLYPAQFDRLREIVRQHAENQREVANDAAVDAATRRHAREESMNATTLLETLNN